MWGALGHDGARTLRRLVLLLHLIIAGAWLYYMAGGFPLLHSRFWANRGLPVAILLLCALGIYADRAGRQALLHSITTCMAAAWLVASLTGIALFPISARFLLPIGLIIALALYRLRLGRSELQRPSSPLTVLFVVVGVGVGVLVPLTQRAAVATTHPINARLGGAASEPAGSVPEITFSRNLRVAPADGTISLRREGMALMIYPMLTFISRSPDRCWTLFSPPERREAPERRLTQWSRSDSSVKLRYTDLGTSELTVSASAVEAADIEAISQLPEPVYSHLNTYCEISLMGHTKLSLAFSPCPDSPVDVLPSDYPVGRPARFAYLDARGIFHVVEAASGEKGPFHELARGPLPREQALEITILDNNHALGSVALADWAAQVSTDLSPTAGWGVSQNAIEFSLEGDSPRSVASLFVSLASTSVGRGFDSVGHASGVYRNRMTVRLLPP